jgi:hypothetical protein
MSEECLTVEARSKSPLLRGAWWLTGVLTLLGLLPSVGYFVASWGDLRNRSDQLSVGLPLMQVAGTVALIVWLGRPRSGRDVCVLVALNLVDFAARQYGPGFTIETGMRAPFQDRVQQHLLVVQTAVKLFEERHAS